MDFLVAASPFRNGLVLEFHRETQVVEFPTDNLMDLIYP